MPWWSLATLEERRRAGNSFFLGAIIGNPDVPGDSSLTQSAILLGRSLGIQIEEIVHRLRKHKDWVGLLTDEFELLPRPYLWAFLAGFYGTSLLQYYQFYLYKRDEHTRNRIEEARAKMLENLNYLQVPEPLYRPFSEVADHLDEMSENESTVSEYYKQFITRVRLWLEGMEELLEEMDTLQGDASSTTYIH